MFSHLGITCRGWTQGSTGGWCFHTSASLVEGGHGVQLVDGVFKFGQHFVEGGHGVPLVDSFLRMPLCVSHS